MHLSKVIPFPGGRLVDPPEQALAEAGAAALAGQDLTDASLALYLARLHAAGRSPAFDGKARAAGRGQVDGMRFSEVDTAATVAANDGGSVAGLRDAALLAVASEPREWELSCATVTAEPAGAERGAVDVALAQIGA